jgi:hypothetical protein
MSMATIKDILLIDPSREPLVNNGQARLADQTDEKVVAELRGELKMFVCEGEFARGLDCILSEYLGNLGNSSQKAVWVSGFFGSGKSHLLKMLAHLWANTAFADGATARGIVPEMPKGISAHFTELDQAGRRYGGLFAAAGTLLAGSHDRVRETVLGVILRAAGLPDRYPVARFVLWLEREDAFDKVKGHVEANGGTWEKELANLWVSTRIRKAILAWDKHFAPSEAEVRAALKQQFQEQTGDLTTADFIGLARDVLLRHAAQNSNNPEQLPCTVILLDEAQQYIGDSHDRSTIFTELAEALTKQFDGRVLLVAAGQQALNDVELLHKLMDRFVVKVPLSDTDVETVTRKVSLRKKPAAIPTVKTTIEAHGGEIARHLQGTKIGPRSTDDKTIIDDFPLLPVRRRFWEECFRQIDAAGTKSQLRSQLSIIHDAVGNLAAAPVTAVIPADALYDSLKAYMLGTGVLLREIHERIEELGMPGTADAKLAKRIASLVFLISKLPTNLGADLGVRASSAHIADLLVSDLAADNHVLRQKVADALEKLVEAGLLMKVDDEYRMQTRAGQEWLATYSKKQQEIRGSEPMIQEVRNNLLYAAIDEAVRGVRIVQGLPKEPRDLAVNRDATPPTPGGRGLTVWVRDGWAAAEKDVHSAARKAGATSSLIYSFIPKAFPEELKTAIVNSEAATRTLETYGPQSEAEGQEAMRAMTSLRDSATANRDRLVREIVGSAKVWLGGGNEQLLATLSEKLKAAADAAVVRQFPQFSAADKGAWDVVMKRAKEGDHDKALEAVGHSGAAESHAVCAEVLNRTATGATGSDVRSQLQDPPYGWPKDAIDAALVVLVGAGHLSAKLNNAPITHKQLDQNKITKTSFTRETKTISMADRLKVRGTLSKFGLKPKTNDEDIPLAADFLKKLADVGRRTGGEEPLPAAKSIVFVEDIQRLTGVEMLAEMVAKKADLDAAADAWPKLADLASARLTDWEDLGRLFDHAKNEPGVAAINADIEAIRSGRLLLDVTDPLPPIRAKIAEILRKRLKEMHEDHRQTFNREVKQLAASSVWSQLPSDKQTAILAEVGLREPDTVDVSTDAAIAAALAERPIESRRNAALAVPTLAGQALRKAAASTVPEARSVTVEKTTLRTDAEVREWAKRAESHLLEEVKKGPVLVS